MALLIARLNVPRWTPPASLGGLRTETPHVIDDVPDVGDSHLASYAFHLGIASHTVGDDREDLAVSGSVYPLGIGEIGRTWILRREVPVTEPFRPVALPAGPHICLTTPFDRTRRGRYRILDCGRLRIAALGR